MNKILSGILGVLIVAGVVGGAAFAVLTDAASLTNLALSTGTADLLIKLGTDSSYTNDRDVTTEGVFAGAFIPGSFQEVEFNLKNDTTSDVDLLLTGRLLTATGDWEALKAALSCVVYVSGGDPESVVPTVSSGWFTLEQWNFAPRDLPGDPLSPAEEQALVLRCRLPESADNSTSGKSITGVEFEFTGTQEVVAP